MERISKSNYYLAIALSVSKRSTCLKRHYGCIIVKNDEIIATGYNGSPRGAVNCCDTGICKRLDTPHNTGDYSDCCSVHAEQNAMLSASRKDMIGSTLYLACEDWTIGYEDERMETIKYQKWNEIRNPSPCPICTRMIMNAGIASVINKCGELVLRELV
jgi:dCMP deaminase